MRRCKYSNTHGRTSRIAIVGAPFSGGQPKDGVQHFPLQFRQQGFLDQIQKLHKREVIDYGDVKIPEYCTKLPTYTEVDGYCVRNSYVCGQVSQRVASMVARATSGSDDICVTLGGDHSVATGSIIGHHMSRENLCVIWVDAHNDLNTPDTSPSGNIHGMALSFLVKGRSDLIYSIPGYEWAAPCLDPRDIIFIGSRDTDPKEYEHVMELGIPILSMRDIDRDGIDHVMKEAVKLINPRLDRPMHISYDIDSLDPIHAPGTGTRVPGGLSLREGIYIGEYVSGLGLLRGIDIVEVNTQLCENDVEIKTTMDSSMAVLNACLGHTRPKSMIV